MLEEADVVVYNESVELTEQRVNSGNRAKTNKYSDRSYHETTLSKIEELQKNESTKEFHKLGNGEYLSDTLLDNNAANNTNTRLDGASRPAPPRLT